MRRIYIIFFLRLQLVESTKMSGEELMDATKPSNKKNSATVQWFALKAHMINPGHFQLSRDKDVKSGAKEFTSFTNHSDMIKCLNVNKNRSLYEILVNKTDPCFMYFDIDIDFDLDIPDVQQKTEAIIGVFCTTLSTFLYKMHDLKVEWIEGDNCQIATASTNKKCSVHFVGYIHMASIDYHKRFTQQFIQYIMENDIKDLTYLKKGNITCGIDISVYSQFRSYRCLYMQKINKANQLMPYGKSSKHIVDHLVNYHKAYSKTPFATLEGDTIPVEASIPSLKKPKVLKVTVAPQKETNVLNTAMNTTDTTEPSAYDDNTKSVTFSLLEKVVMGINKNRAKDRESWLEVMFAIASTSKRNGYVDDGWDLLERFSLQETMNYKSRENMKQYDSAVNSSRQDTINFGSLVFFLKEDNYDLYKELFKYADCAEDANIEGIDKLLDTATSGSHYDVAVVVKAMLCHQIKHIEDKLWYVWDSVSGLWKEDRGGKTIRIELSTTICSAFAKRIIYWNDRIRIDDDNKDRYEERVKKLLYVCEKLKDNYYKNSVVRECEPMLSDSGFLELLDENTNIMGFNNGVYDFTTATFRKGRPDDYITLSVGYNYPDTVTEEARRNVMKVFTDPFGSEDLTKYVLQILASCMDGRRKFQEYYIWTGRGSNGKSTIQELIMQTFGDYAKPLDIAFWTKSRREAGGAMPELADKKGVRFVFSNEPEATDRIQVAKIKEVTGGERITARKLYCQPVTFRPQFGIFILCNDLPELSKTDGGIERRTRIVPYSRQFKQNPIPGQLIADPMVLENCKNNVEWRMACMRLLLDTYATIRSLMTLVLPLEIINASRQYMEENNPIGIWLKDNFEITNDENDRVPVDEMWMLYKSMVDKNIAKNVFGTSMTNMNNINRKQIKVNKINRYYYIGIRKINTMLDEEED